jgi:beta-lactamase regulating signal transducer with metallopeptidase domain
MNATFTMNALCGWLGDGLLIAAAATLAARLIPSSAPSQKHLFWWLTLVAIVAVPWMPDGASRVFTDHALVPIAPLVTFGPRGESASALLTLPTPPRDFIYAVACVWSLSLLLQCGAFIRSLRAIRRLAVNSHPLATDRIERFQVFEAARRSSRHVRVCVSSGIRGACAVGYRQPRILIAADLVERLDERAVEAIVLHEYAHLERYDDWSCLLQWAVRAVCGLHPAVWWVARHIDIEREAACDRAVVTRTGAPTSYARALAAAAEIVPGSRGLTPIATPGASMLGGGLHARVCRVLDTTTASRRRAWCAALGSGVVLVAAVGAAERAPQLVGVEPLALAASAASPTDASPDGLRAGESLAYAAGATSQTATPVDSRRAGEPLGPGSAASEQPNASGAIAGVPLQTRRVMEGQFETRVADSSRGTSTPGDGAPDERSAASSTTPDTATSSTPVLDASGLLAREPIALSQPRALTPLVAPPASALNGLVAPKATSAAVESGIGHRAASVGAVTGEAASRAGTSVARFFRRGGRAVAERF